MTAATEAGAIVYPPVPAFYTKPGSLDEIVNHTVGRALDLFGIDSKVVARWAGTKRTKATHPASE
jgi:4-hydroxy-3-polyprenylbenzoate decarboxylase